MDLQMSKATIITLSAVVIENFSSHEGTRKNESAKKETGERPSSQKTYSGKQRI